MGKKDVLSKDYMSDNRKFADVFNYYLYDGEQVIKPQDLKEKDITEMVFPYKDKHFVYPVEKYRDILKQCVIKADSEYTYFLLGIENQSDIHYAMPVKSMVYDALNYASQVNMIAKEHRICKDKMGSDEFLSGFTKEDKLIPIITLVIYWGADVWNTPKSLYEMFWKTDLKILRFVNDYKINLIAPWQIKDFSRFHTEVGKVLEYINASKDLEKMKEVLEKNREYYLHMDIDSARMIELFGQTKLELKESEEEEEVNMCKAIDDMIQEAVEEKETEMWCIIVEMAKKWNIAKEEVVEKIKKEYELPEKEMKEILDRYY